MNKGEMKGSETAAATADKPLNTKVRIELEYDMLSSQLLMKSGSPTVVIMGVLRKAESAKVTELREQKLGAPRRILIDYDLASDDIKVETDASPLIYVGILAMAHSMVTQNQMLQRIQAMGAASKIVRPT